MERKNDGKSPFSLKFTMRAGLSYLLITNLVKESEHLPCLQCRVPRNRQRHCQTPPIGSVGGEVVQGG